MSIELIVLFVEGQPMIYEVEKKQNHFVFTPLTSWQDKLEATSFTLEKINEKWEVTGTPDKNIVDQAIEEIEKKPF